VGHPILTSRGRCWPVGILSSIVLLCAASPVRAQPPDPSAECLECHADPVDRTFTNGSTRTLEVHLDRLLKSVHAGKATCVDCHPGAREVPHPDRRFASSRQLTIAESEQCRQCHFTEYRQAREGVHGDAVARGDLTAPVCVDCHGGHDIQRPQEPRTRVATTCGQCHAATARTYAASVHGEDVARNITDVPTCVDCHGGHQIAGPREAGWRTRTPEVCGGCHGDPARMDKYGLSTNVLQTYVADFHGRTAALRTREGSGHEAAFVAVCSDCHGTHDVSRVDAASSPALKTNLVNTCRTCHADASETFPDSWLSHYEPSWERTPALQAVKTAYAVLIPFMIGGLVLQMLLHLWRMAVNR
jgi:nitrate/TMAO reductase-like tetraheme cytochrome c subunit